MNEDTTQRGIGTLVVVGIAAVLLLAALSVSYVVLFSDETSNATRTATPSEQILTVTPTPTHSSTVTPTPIPTLTPSPTPPPTPSPTPAPTLTPSPTPTSAPHEPVDYSDTARFVYSYLHIWSVETVDVMGWGPRGHTFWIVLNGTYEYGPIETYVPDHMALTAEAYRYAWYHHQQGNITGDYPERLRVVELNQPGVTPTAFTVYDEDAKAQINSSITELQYQDRWINRTHTATTHERAVAREIAGDTPNYTLGGNGTGVEEGYPWIDDDTDSENDTTPTPTPTPTDAQASLPDTLATRQHYTVPEVASPPRTRPTGE